MIATELLDRVLVVSCLTLLASCGGRSDESVQLDPPVTCAGDGDYQYADVIVEAPGTVDSPSAINEPENAINGVVEGEPKSGGLDVFSRGYSTDPPNNFLVLEWSNRILVDVDGPDFVIFENAFETAGGVFMDQIVVEVSSDGSEWVAFDHDYVADDELSYSRDPDDWLGFAGVTPVRWRSSECTDPMDEGAGGDRFDLADLPDEALADGVRYLRLTSAPSLTNPDTDAPFPRDPLGDGFDLDGVFAAATRAR